MNLLFSDDPLPPPQGMCTVIEMPGDFHNIATCCVGDHLIIENSAGQLQVIQYAQTCMEVTGDR